MYATDCRSYYGQTDNGPLPQPDSVNCLQFKRPVELISTIQRYLTVFFVMWINGPSHVLKGSIYKVALHGK